MTRHLHKIRHHARRAVRATLTFLGRVAESVKGELSRDEWKRVATKFAGTYMAGVSYKVITKDPSFYGELLAPLVPATVIGLGDALRRLGHGSEPGTPPDGPLPPASEPTA
jgi:hypothetical protein